MAVRPGGAGSLSRAAVAALMALAAVALALAASYPRASDVERFLAEERRRCRGEHGHLESGEIERLYQLLLIVTATFKRHGVRYFATCGTLLGAVRHGGLIPWDDDADLGVLEDDRGALEAAFVDLEAIGIDCSALGDYAEFNPRFRGAWFPFVDVFLVRRGRSGGADGRDVFEYSNPKNRKAWPDEFYLPGELLPLQGGIPFGQIELAAPADPEAFLTRAYGADWPSVVKPGYNHRDDHDVPEERAGELREEDSCYF